TAAIPDESRIDSPYYQPLVPGSSGNVPGDTGGAAQQEGGGGGAASTGAGTTTITILQGSAVQGSPDYDPDTAQVPVGNRVVWHNEDTVPHTATSGNDPQDPQSGQLFDTSIINGGEESTPVELQGASEGQTISYHCMVHPYMAGEITVTAAAGGGGQGDVGGGGAQTQGGGATNQTGANATTAGANATTAGANATTAGANATTAGANATTAGANATTAGGGGTTAGNATTTGATGNTTGTSTTSAGGSNSVSIVSGATTLTDTAYQPNPIQVSVGATVTWTNNDSQPHTVTSGSNGQPDNKFNSSPNFTPLLNAGQTFSFTFTQAGDYPYFCMLHPNMVGTVSVSG
ncbi:MAG TPA: plastocyanin/azurin family copper-binding protein, partial [Nitrososphaera sp.]|nr:plastocyanin/azurin family copper-binding protein [Nitrososphaera sp.]